MSDTTETTTNETTETAEVEPVEVEQHTEQQANDETNSENANKEAAKYRRRLRETEQERDTLRSQLEVMRKAEAERIAGEVIANASGLWAAGVDVATLLDQDGRVDAQKVRDAAQKAATQLGLAPSRRHGNFAPLQGRYPNQQSKSNGFESAFAPPKP